MFGFSDLEERLLSDDGPAVCASTVEQLRALRSELETLTKSGLSARDFDDAQLLLAAFNACEQIVLDTSHLKGA